MKKLRISPTKEEVRKWFKEGKLVYYSSYSYNELLSIQEYRIIDISNLFKRKDYEIGYVACEEIKTSTQYWVYYNDLFGDYEEVLKYFIDRNIQDLRETVKGFDNGYSRLLQYLAKSNKYYLKKRLEIQYPEIGVKNEIT